MHHLQTSSYMLLIAFFLVPTTCNYLQVNHVKHHCTWHRIIRPVCFSFLCQRHTFTLPFGILSILWSCLSLIPGKKVSLLFQNTSNTNFEFSHRLE